MPWRYLGIYLRQSRRVWNHVPVPLRRQPLGRLYGGHLNALVLRCAERQQYYATFFLRNRAELELMRRLADSKARDSRLDITVLACSKGAEAYSILWTLRSARPDLNIHAHAVDISREILDFAQRGVYSLNGIDISDAELDSGATLEDVIYNTFREQPTSMFERMSKNEIESMFELKRSHAKVRPWLKKNITWVCADVRDPRITQSIESQDIVVANRFLCHMNPAVADACLRNVSRLVKPGGYLFVSGVDLGVRTRVAQSMGWVPVTDLIKEIHEGDHSLRSGWPFEYWGLEPLDDRRADWETRYASVFQIGQPGSSS